MATTFPVAVSYEWLLMVDDTIEAVYREELGRGVDPSGRASAMLLALQGKTVEDLRAWLRASVEWHEKHDRVLPPPPTRDEVCGIHIRFQGSTAHTREFGDIPVFGPETSVLNDDDLDTYVQERAEEGATHVEIAISWNYEERDYRYPVPGRDLTANLSELKRRIVRMLTADPQRRIKAVLLFLAGDGRSAPKGPDGHYPYNDPQGWTYGHEWLMETFPAIADALAEVKPYLLCVPGYDGVFYGWGDDHDGIDRQPQRVLAFGSLFRQVWPDGYLGLEHSTGHIPIGEGGAEFSTGMQVYDVILSEFDNWPATGDPTWQIAARLLGPAYRRPADEPASDDPRPPFYLAPGTPRGPYFTCAYEFGTYPWVRARLSAADVDRGRAYYRALGYQFTG
jgi:hypothetical protein